MNLYPRHTYTKTGGRAEILIRPKSILELEHVCQYAYKNKIPLTILGNGSNVIISDKGIRGITIIMIHIQDDKGSRKPNDSRKRGIIDRGGKSSPIF